MTESQLSSKKIREFKPGDRIIGFFIVRKKELKTKKDQTPYILLELGDQSGRISCTLWDNVKSFYDTINVGDMVKVKGTVIIYNDSQQISVEKIRKAKPEDKITEKDFLRRGNIETEALKNRLKITMESVKNSSLKSLLQYFFNDSEWLARFTEAPGGKLWHHAYIGGLMEHTAAVAEICDSVARLYPAVDRDLLITGAILHDIGKIDEYRLDQGFIDYSDEGRLWGHVSIGYQQVKAAIEKMENNRKEFPEELKKLLLHLILSHQGKHEQGAPVLPMTLEAMILYYADELDSKANALLHIMERDNEPDRHWSKYVPLLERFIYMGNK